MIHAADIRKWRNRSVVDPKGHKIGALEAIYVDTTTDEPAMATVCTGLPTRQPSYPSTRRPSGRTTSRSPTPRRW